MRVLDEDKPELTICTCFVLYARFHGRTTRVPGPWMQTPRRRATDQAQGVPPGATLEDTV